MHINSQPSCLRNWDINLWGWRILLTCLINSNLVKLTYEKYATIKWWINKENDGHFTMHFAHFQCGRFRGWKVWTREFLTDRDIDSAGDRIVSRESTASCGMVNKHVICSPKSQTNVIACILGLYDHWALELYPVKKIDHRPYREGT